MHCPQRVIVAVVVLALTTSLALAQGPVYLSPEAFQTGKGSVLVRPFADSGSIQVPWGTLPVRWAFVKTGRVQENRDDLGDWMDGQGNFHCPVPGPGAVMLGIDFKPVIELVPGATLAKIMAAPSTGFETVRVRHYRSAIALFRSNEEDESSTIATTETSLSSSIHPLMDPSRFQLGGDMPFELVLQGTEVEHGTVRAYSVESGKELSLTTRGGGLGFFRPVVPGEHRLSFQTARSLVGDKDADYELFTTTLTFCLPTTEAAR